MASADRQAGRQDTGYLFFHLGLFNMISDSLREPASQVLRFHVR